MEIATLACMSLSTRKQIFTLTLFFYPWALSANHICNDFLDIPTKKYRYASKSISKQLGISEALVKRYSEDPYVINMAFDLLQNKGRILTYNGFEVGSYFQANQTEPELKIFHLKLINISIDEKPLKISTGFAKFFVGLNIALNIYLRQNPYIRISFVTILNPNLYKQLLKQFSANETLKSTTFPFDLKQIELNIYKP